jgi:prephenate dehydrogenase
VRRVAIVGLGLIGGSLGLAIRRQLPRVEVVGVARRQETAGAAERMGAVARAGTSLSLLAGADLVVLACPLAVTAAVLDDSVPHLDEGARVTDVGSAKQEVVEHATRVLDGDRNPFLGGHPMAGKEVTGIANAAADLFQGRPWIFTPRAGWYSALPQTPGAARAGNRTGYEPGGWEDVIQAIRDIGALPAFLAPRKHDRYVAMVSHVPFLVSAAYLLSVGREDDWDDAAELASSGFRDVSRLGAGDSEMYAAITSFNRQEVLVAMNALRAALDRFEGAIRNGDDLGLLDLLVAAREIRDNWAAGHPQLS